MPSTVSLAPNLNPVLRARIPDALNISACQHLTREIEAHASALKSWAGITLSRMHSPRAVTAGTAQMLLDIAAQMETEASICAGLAQASARGAAINFGMRDSMTPRVIGLTHVEY